MRQAIIENHWPLTLIGDAGTGKTCAALTFADWSGGAAYIDVAGLCGTFRQAQQGKLERVMPHASVGVDEWMLWEVWSDAQVAIVDEIGGRGAVSDAHYETLKLAIDKRLNYDKPLICISNLPLARIAQVYDDRIASRLGGGILVNFGSEDQRIQAE